MAAFSWPRLVRCCSAIWSNWEAQHQVVAATRSTFHSPSPKIRQLPKAVLCFLFFPSVLLLRTDRVFSQSQSWFLCYSLCPMLTSPLGFSFVCPATCGTFKCGGLMQTQHAPNKPLPEFLILAIVPTFPISHIWNTSTILTPPSFLT